MRRIKAGVVGMGFIGLAHVEALKRLEHVEVAAIAGRNDRIKNKAEQLGIEKCHTDYKEMLRDQEIDCIHICTPNDLHFDMVKEALLSGKHVICEKPLTTTVKEAEELIRLAEREKLIHAVNFNIRFYPMMHQLRMMVQREDLGSVYSVHGSYLQDWLFFDTDYNWRLEPELSGESRAVADIGSHWMDLVEFVTGLKITEVFADFAIFHKARKKPLKNIETYSGMLLSSDDYSTVDVNTEDYATVLFNFNNGGKGAMTVSQVAAGRKNRVSFELGGSKKSVAWDSEKPNEMWMGKRDGYNEILLKDPSLFYPESRGLVDYPGGHNEGFPDTFKQIFKEIYRAISQRQNENEWRFPTFKEGLREIMLCEKIIESNKKRMWVKV